MYLYDHNTAKRLQEEKIKRSLARSPHGIHPIDSFVRPQPEIDADIVEVEFGTWCESHPLGA